MQADPNRAAIGARGLSAMSPMRLRPARAMSATVVSSRPSAASGRSWKSLAKALSLKISGAIFCAENRASGEALQAILDKGRLAAEEVRDAGQIEREPVPPVQSGERGIARAPVAKPLEEPRLRRGRRLDRDEGGMARARIRQRKAGGQAQLRSGGVD